MISPELQIRLLEALKTLEFDGAPLVNAGPPHCRFIYRFRGGVPFILLRAWLEALPTDLSDTLALSLRRELVTEHTCHLFRSLLPKRRRADAQEKGKLIFARPDAQHVMLEWEPVPKVGFFVIGTAGKLEPDGSFRVNELLPTIKPSAAAKFLRITAAGIRWLEDQHRGTQGPAPAKELGIRDGNSDAAAAASGVVTIDMKQLKLLIRQQLKAEERTRLTDDILVAAYRLMGSYRKAAAFLTQETGQKVSKDQVYRAVQRAGGVKEVLKTEDSESIQRTVASQRRDRRQRFASPTQPPEIK